MAGHVSRHAACDSCFTSRTHARNQGHGVSPADVCCSLQRCPNPGCHFEPHACKLDDHARLVCLFQRVPCVNACNGCAAELRRGDMHAHLKTCPASVVRCMAEWNRWPVMGEGSGAGGTVEDDNDLCPGGVPADASEDRVIIRSSNMAMTGNDCQQRNDNTISINGNFDDSFATPTVTTTNTNINDVTTSASRPPLPDYLDVALMKRDQRALDASRKIPLKLKSALRNNINRKHPAAPVEVPLIWGAAASHAQSSFTVGSGNTSVKKSGFWLCGKPLV